MATLTKVIEGDNWKKEIPTEKIREIYPCGEGKVKVWYVVDRYNNTESIVCDSIKF